MQAKFLLMIFSLLLSMPALAANPQIEFQTSHGSFVVELYPDKAPKTVENFLKYVEVSFYLGTVFHRTIDRFMIQGGGFTADLKAKPTFTPVVNEANNGLKNEPGTLSMARAFDPDSATSQFFINIADNKFLNFYKPDPHYYGYCVFGKVIRGMDVIQRIGQLPTTAVGPHANVPLQPVIIEKVSMLDKPVQAETPTAGNKLPSSSTKPASKGKKRG